MAGTESYDRGPLIPYEVMWRSGHREVIHAHQVLWPHEESPIAAALGLKTERHLDPRVKLHGEIDGRWQLLLVADEKDILSIRRLFDQEV